jgi:hypothetical protein
MRLALLGIVVSVLAMESTSNSKQWHTDYPEPCKSSRIMQSYLASPEYIENGRRLNHVSGEVTDAGQIALQTIAGGAGGR